MVDIYVAWEENKVLNILTFGYFRHCRGIIHKIEVA